MDRGMIWSLRLPASRTALANSTRIAVVNHGE
jgi:hypothetical protein